MLLTTDQECAKLVSEEMTHQDQFSALLLEDQRYQESWLDLIRKKFMSEVKHNKKEVSLELSNQSNMELLPIGMIWKKYGTIPFIMNSEYHQRNTQS